MKNLSKAYPAWARIPVSKTTVPKAIKGGRDPISTNERLFTKASHPQSPGAVAQEERCNNGFVSIDDRIIKILPCGR